MGTERGGEILTFQETVWFLICKDGKYLLQQRLRQDKSHFGDFVIPGGHIEEGESSEEALFREAGEEAKIKPVDAVLLGNFKSSSPSGNTFLVHVYLVRNYEGKIEEREPEKSKFVWCSLPAADFLLQNVGDKYALLLTQKYISAKNSG